MEEPQSNEKTEKQESLVQEQSIIDLPRSLQTPEETLQDKRANDCHMEVACATNEIKGAENTNDCCEINEVLNKTEIEVSANETLTSDTEKQVFCEESKQVNLTESKGLLNETNEHETCNKSNESEATEPMEIAKQQNEEIKGVSLVETNEQETCFKKNDGEAVEPMEIIKQKEEIKEVNLNEINGSMGESNAQDSCINNNESERVEPMEVANEKDEKQANSDSVVVLNVASSLGAIASAYGDSEDEEEQVEEVQGNSKVEMLDTSGTKEYRKPIEVSSSDSSDSEDDSSSSEGSSESSSSESDSEDESLNKKQPKKNNANERRGKVKKTEKGEYDDLPPIEDLKISMPEVLCDPLGEVAWMVDQMVVVKPKPGKPTLNIDTVLFIEKGKRVLGQIFEVFGQVTDPHYAVRFNNAQHIIDNNVKTGMIVYYCPNTPHTSLVFVSDLTKMKATEDLDDEEAPQFSDDEEERAYYENLKKQGKPGRKNNSDVPEKRRKTQNKPTWKQKHPWNTNAQSGYRPREPTANGQGLWSPHQAPQMPNYYPQNQYMTRNLFGHYPPHHPPYNHYVFGQPPRGPPIFNQQSNPYTQYQPSFPPPNVPWESSSRMYPPGPPRPPSQPDSNFPS